MSEENTEQAVVEEPKEQAPPAAEGSDARDDGLEALLREFDEKAAPRQEPKPEPAKATAPDPDVKTLAERLEKYENERAAERFNADLNLVVKDIRGELDPEFFDDELVKAWIDAEARRDARLQKAWTERHDKPREFKRITEGLGRKFHSKFGKLPDKNATEDREVVAHAVRGASTKAPEGKAPNFSGMSNNEYREAVKKEYGFDPGV